jgi:hypothetical protein
VRVRLKNYALIPCCESELATDLWKKPDGIYELTLTPVKVEPLPESPGKELFRVSNPTLSVDDFERAWSEIPVAKRFAWEAKADAVILFYRRSQ